MATQILEARGVSYTYPGESEPAVKRVSLGLSEGTITCIVGPNGSGKSTLLLLMGGLLRPDEGAVYYRGRPLLDQLPWVRSRIGVLFQNPEVMMFNPTVYDEIAHGPRQLYNEAEVKERVRNVAELLGLSSTGILERSTASLSFGVKKIVAIASILSYDPEVLLLDEPFSSLDPNRAEAIAKIVRELAYEGKAIAFTSTTYTEIKVQCTRIMCINNGVLTECS